MDGGTLYTTGAGEVGQLGFESDGVNVPTVVETAKNIKVKNVVCGGMQTWVLTEDGEVFSFGNNDEGSLGRKTEGEDSEIQPGRIVLPKPCLQVAGGDTHCAALLEDGSVFGWGSFQLMQSQRCGVNVEVEEDITHEPTLISKCLKNKVVKIASGGKHLVMSCENGKVYTLGDGSCGQLGRKLPDKYRGDKRKHMLTPGLVTLVKSGKFHKALDIWAGEYTTYIQCRDTFWVFGSNNWNHCGVANSREVVVYPTCKNELANKKWKVLAGGEQHTLAVDEEGKAYAFGRNIEGQCGVPNAVECLPKPVVIPALQGTLVRKVAAGSRSSFAITNDGALYCWGVGDCIGLGDDIDKDQYHHEPKRLRLDESVAVDVDGGGQHSAMVFQPHRSCET